MLQGLCYDVGEAFEKENTSTESDNEVSHSDHIIK